MLKELYALLYRFVIVIRYIQMYQNFLKLVLILITNHSICPGSSLSYQLVYCNITLNTAVPTKLSKWCGRAIFSLAPAGAAEAAAHS